MDFGLGVLPISFEPLPFFCSIVSIAVRLESCQLPTCDLFTSLALLSSFGRETSLVNITGPRSIFPPLFTPLVYFQLLLSLALILCKQQGRRNCQLLYTRWKQSYLLCVQVHVSLVSIRKLILAPLTPSCISASPTSSITLVSSPREIFCYYISPSTWYKQRGVRELSSSPYHLRTPNVFFI